MKAVHSFPIRVYYEDTDTGGVVYYANYLKFAERARTEALRKCGIKQSELMREENIGFAVRRCEAEFFKPARLDDLLTIETRLTDINKVSLRMEQTIRRGRDVLVSLDVKIAVIDGGMKLARLPESVKKKMSKILK